MTLQTHAVSGFHSVHEYGSVGACCVSCAFRGGMRSVGAPLSPLSWRRVSVSFEFEKETHAEVAAECHAFRPMPWAARENVCRDVTALMDGLSEKATCLPAFLPGCDGLHWKK
mmetsp:Transcript_7084/g.13905  ORF Transcript_7084/g.13905 Transcript_7084/m.13905 type:complete len:113 (-) Transcript_7084:451-789(-)